MKVMVMTMVTITIMALARWLGGCKYSWCWFPRTQDGRGELTPASFPSASVLRHMSEQAEGRAGSLGPEAWERARNSERSLRLQPRLGWEKSRSSPDGREG